MSITAGAAYTGREIINAAQFSLAQATTGIKDTAVQAAHELHAEPFYLEAEFWVGVAFISVILFLARPLARMGSAMLHKRIENIKTRLDEASDLFDDAQKLLADYEKKYRNAKKEAGIILEKSQKQIEYIKTANLSKLEQDTRVKEKDAEDRITASLANANKELTDMASTLTIRTVRQALSDNFTDKARDKLIDHAIAAIGRLK